MFGKTKRNNLEVPTMPADVEIENILSNHELSDKEKEKRIKKITRKQAKDFLKKGGKIY